MSLRIRRGTEAQRTGVTFDSGELVYTTDTKQLWIGDGVTAGGSPVVGSNITGYGLTFNATSKRIEVAGLTADDISNGINNKFFSTDLAQDAAASLFAAGTHTNISFQYDDTLNKINATVTLDGIGLTDIVADTSPQLGANLDLNAKDITGTGNLSITGNITATGGTVTASSLVGSTLTANTSFTSPIATVSNQLNVDNITAGSFGLGVSSNSTTPLSVTGIGTLGPSSGQVYFNINAAKGTLTAPTTTAANDGLGGIAIQGYDGTGYKSASLIVAAWDATATLADTFPKSNLRLITGGGGSTLRFATFDANGVFSVPVLQVSNVAGTLPSSPAAGMIVLDGTTFKGYDGSAWVNLN